jgi:hypothetical protein
MYESNPPPRYEPKPSEAQDNAMMKTIYESNKPTPENLAKLKLVAKNGISNFYWIAAMTVINSLANNFGGGIYFVIGLGATLFIDGIASALAKELVQYATIVKIIGIVFSAGIALMFALFGYFGIKGHRWVVIVGMVLYGMDAFLMLFFKDWLGFGFHLFFLFGLWNGLRASDQLRKMLMQSQPKPLQTDFPANIGS